MKMGSQKLLLPLEDDVQDIIGKASRGRERGGGVLSRDWGELSEEEQEQWCLLVGLNRQKLNCLSLYSPRVVLPPFLEQCDFPYADSGVNLWILELLSGYIFVDAGCSLLHMNKALEKIVAGDKPVLALLVTHRHHDHVAGLDLLKERYPLLQCINTGRGSVEGACRELSCLTRCDIVPHFFQGHSLDGCVYEIKTRGYDLVFTGDVLFAGSIGGVTPVLYVETLRHINAFIEKMPCSSLLLPGHGPATTVALEKENNPFL